MHLPRTRRRARAGSRSSRHLHRGVPVPVPVRGQVELQGRTHDGLDLRRGQNRPRMVSTCRVRCGETDRQG